MNQSKFFKSINSRQKVHRDLRSGKIVKIDQTEVDNKFSQFLQMTIQYIQVGENFDAVLCVDRPKKITISKIKTADFRTETIATMALTMMTMMMAIVFVGREMVFENANAKHTDVCVCVCVCMRLRSMKGQCE